MRKHNVFERLLFVALIAVIYIIVDVPLRSLSFGNFDPYLGVKNFIPITLGMLYGVYGMIGTVVGAVISAFISDATFSEGIFEVICVVIQSLGAWLLWFYVKSPHTVKLKKWWDYLRYILIVILLSTVCGVIGMAIFSDVTAFVKVFFVYFSFDLLLGVPTIIIMTSVVAIYPVCPPWYKFNFDIDTDITAEMKGFDETNEAIEETCFNKKINRKAAFGIQNCLEEFVLRIHSGGVTANIIIKIEICDSTSIYLNYQDKKFNPLKIHKGESEDELLGLMLIKHRALRASYTYRNGVNSLHIVI